MADYFASNACKEFVEKNKQQLAIELEQDIANELETEPNIKIKKINKKNVKNDMRM